jgi:hypothetical protein
VLLDLIGREVIEVGSLVSGVSRSSKRARSTRFGLGSLAAVGVLLEYPAPRRTATRRMASRTNLGRYPITSVGCPRQRAAQARSSWRSFIGAQLCLIDASAPLARLDTAQLAHVAPPGPSAVNAQRRFGFTTASTSADAVLDDTSLTRSSS